MVTNIFYRFPSKGTKIATFDDSRCTIDRLYDFLESSEGIGRQDVIIAKGTRLFKPGDDTFLSNDSLVDVLVPLPGGKGGFGSLLRAIGAQIEKTTNRDACRDLSGRRLRDIKREEELKKLIALQEKLQNEREQRRKEKQKNKASDESSKKTGDSEKIAELVALFNDQDYDKRHLELGSIIDAAIDKGLINFKKRQQEDIESGNNSAKRAKTIGTDDISDAGRTTRDTMVDKKVYRKETSKIHNKNLWLGLDDDDYEDGEDTDDR